MDAAPKSCDWITPEEYLEGERASEVRHEYVDGRVYAMAGASDDHNRIAGNIFRELSNALRGKRCEPFITDMKVKVPSLSITDAYFYPDVLVACDPTDNAKYYRERPTLIIEVLSPETERTDQREKAIAYRQIPSVEMYVLVEQDRQRVTVLHRAEPGWRKEVLEGPAAILKLESLGVEIPFTRIYERTAAAAAHSSGA
jgi:Uma2 family endonuclease